MSNSARIVSMLSDISDTMEQLDSQFAVLSDLLENLREVDPGNKQLMAIETCVLDAWRNTGPVLDLLSLANDHAVGA